MQEKIGDSLIMFGNTSVAFAAMLAPEWYTNHTFNAESAVIKFPQTQELIYHRLLLCYTGKLGYIARVVNHAYSVEVGAR